MCGIFAVWNMRKAAELTVIGLHGIQHRAIQYAGIVSSDGYNLFRESGRGVARQVFSSDMLNRLHGRAALGHIRYATVVDDPTRDNTQPIMGVYGGKRFAVAHNGNITNVRELRKMFFSRRMETSIDTEYIVRLIEMHDTGAYEADIARALAHVRGSFAIGILFPDRLIAVNDKSGNRPLSIGSVNGSYVLSSETCAFSGVSADNVANVQPGTMVTFADTETPRSERFAAAACKRCRFEGIYFAHPASNVFGESVTRFRLTLGRALEKHCPVKGGADIVTGVPDSANLIAQGYAESGHSGTYLPVIIRNHYVGRTFIAATQAARNVEIAQKFSFTADEIVGKRIVVVDDSIVRGSTLPTIVRELRRLGAKEVHIRVGSPPVAHPCKYGIDTPTYGELISARETPEEICRDVGADSLAFLPLPVLRSLSPVPDEFCFACWDGKYW